MHDPLDDEIARLRAEIERLRAHIAEIEAWQQKGEELIEPNNPWADKPWTTMFKVGKWWGERPWR
jgi:cell shape-determining protein MreC